MPKNTNKNKNKSNHQKGPNPKNFHSHGIQKKHYGKGEYEKKPFAKNLITDELDVDLERSTQSGENNENRTSRSFRKRQKQKQKQLLQKFDDMVVMKDKQKKLTIGEADEEAKKPLAPTKPHCQLSNVPPEVFGVIVKFLQDYFTCYDANRDGLLSAYNPKVLFSLAINPSSCCTHRTFKFDDYIKESRNLKRVFASDDYHLEKRFRLLHQGHIDTVNTLRKLPPTQHEPSSFKLDHCFFTPHMVTFSVVGYFKEGLATDKVRPLRSFQRVFVCIPDANTGMSIVNEHFTVSNLAVDQYKNYKVLINPAAAAPSSSSSSGPSCETTGTTSQLVTNNLPPGLTEQQMQMMAQFSEHSKLNLRWSHDCLAQCGWNFDAAGRMFIDFKSQIPPDAYIQ